jgi:hypothetical protein
MSEYLKGGCPLEQDSCVSPNKPSSEERVIMGLILLKTPSLEDLVIITDLKPEQVLKEIKNLRKEYGVRGNKRIGYSMGKEPLKCLSMSRHLSDLEEARFAKK